MLNMNTYYSLPVLRSYAAALAHFNNVVPIRGDVDGTKPAGRRDQKWLSIYMREDKSVCIGGMWNKERPLLAYYPDGRVAIETSLGASCRERIQRIAVINIQRRDNEDWVQAVTYVDGEAVEGKYPLNVTWQNKRKVFFLLHENKAPTYLNPIPVYKHVINRKANAEITARYKPFLAYAEAMAKLSADQPSDNPQMPSSTLHERKDMGLPITHLNWRYGMAEETAMQFVNMVESNDPAEWYKAMMWMTTGYWRMYVSDFKNGVKHLTRRLHRDELFTKVRATHGECVRDDYARYFR